MNRLARALTIAAAAGCLVLPATPALATTQPPSEATTAVWCQSILSEYREIPGRGHVTMNGRRFKAGGEVIVARQYAHKPGTRGEACGDAFNRGRFRESGDFRVTRTRIWGHPRGLDRDRAPKTWRNGHYGHQVRSYAAACELDTDGRITRCTTEPQIVSVQTYEVWVRKPSLSSTWQVRTWILPDPAVALREGR